LPALPAIWHDSGMALDFTPLGNAVARLDEGLTRYARDTSDTQIRDGLIQRFEFTYDLAHKLLRRALEADAANPEEVDRMSFPTLIRTGIEQGLVPGDWPIWRTFREMRNIPSHTYDEAKALQVAEGIPEFLAEAQGLLARLLAQT
jgi:nucleotidyltransferase substrate binding protein (TIGR01987 family)